MVFSLRYKRIQKIRIQYKNYKKGKNKVLKVGMGNDRVMKESSQSKFVERL
ncbi:hypothetical protein BCD_1832 (plasmid) [Borrelia crocidurae DOU]|uniref:Uncharacterized protein n=1 Tax=Borrelia crocidurae DOU TaxID=1293575 RepID=W5SMQ4_9SPIR|nr:hypothetical protein BCD_1832 [Borrelia crocidurae DOU]